MHSANTWGQGAIDINHDKDKKSALKKVGIKNCGQRPLCKDLGWKRTLCSEGNWRQMAWQWQCSWRNQCVQYLWRILEETLTDPHNVLVKVCEGKKILIMASYSCLLVSSKYFRIQITQMNRKMTPKSKGCKLKRYRHCLKIWKDNHLNKWQNYHLH